MAHVNVTSILITYMKYWCIYYLQKILLLFYQSYLDDYFAFLNFLNLKLREQKYYSQVIRSK